MPVMRHLNVGGTTYDTVGEASVTQVLSSGTKIATVSIDGTSTDLYAPEGGSGGSTVSVTPILTSGTQTATISVDGTSTTLYAPTPPTVPSASSTTPSMDGTAAVGSSAKYAREDHVHPTDTSRQATLVSGTNIKTVNNESLLGSGNISTPTYTLPTASTSTLGGVKVDGSTITISDGVISSAGGGGFSKLTLYTDGNRTNLWVDSARTETLLEHYGYDLNAARDDFLSSDIIVVIYAGNMFSVLGWAIDTVDEDFYVKVFDGTVSGKLANNGTTITFAKAKVISVS